MIVPRRRLRFVERAALGLLLSLSLLLVNAAPARANLVNFDDIDASAGDVDLSGISPYQGFTWTNFFAYTSAPGFPGFYNGIVSQPNAAYTGGDQLGVPIVGTITAPSPFDFGSADIGSGWYDNLNVPVEGRLGGAFEFTQTIAVSTSGAQLFNFDFAGVGELDFFSTVIAATTDPFGCGPSDCNQYTFRQHRLRGCRAIAAYECTGALSCAGPSIKPELIHPSPASRSHPIVT